MSICTFIQAAQASSNLAGDVVLLQSLLDLFRALDVVHLNSFTYHQPANIGVNDTVDSA